MESTEDIQMLSQFVEVAKKDSKVELECKLLSEKILTKDVADRLLASILSITNGSLKEESRLTFTYPDSTRVNVFTSKNIQKVMVTNTFKEVPLTVEKKEQLPSLKKTNIELPELNTKFTLKSETPLRKDWDGNPNDPKIHTRLLQRRSYKTINELFQIDFSMVRTRPANSKMQLKDLLKKQHQYELEIEFINKNTSMTSDDIAKEYFRVVETLLQSYYQTSDLLKVSDMQRYSEEFKHAGVSFFHPITLLRKHIVQTNQHNILKGYTVTNKADGERSGLYVARDRKVLKINPNGQIIWTGILANDDSHLGDFVDGEFIPYKNLFCIFDIYRFRGRNVTSLPLMKTDEDTIKNPINSRLGCAKLFVDDLKSKFTSPLRANPFRIETKLFLAGDGESMEQAIRTMLDTKFEYETDGLIFTPRLTAVAPQEDRKGITLLRVYKWKPPHQNSIDFLVRISAEDSFDSVLNKRVKKGELYVTKTKGDDIVYPRETLSGEYVPKKLPEDLQKVAQTNARIPAVFQPDVPRDPDAYIILLPLDDKNQPIDNEGNRVEDNTIIECVYDLDTKRWIILRTRYDKTYEYRVLRKPKYGNDWDVANINWMSIHIPIKEDILKTIATNPPDDTFEDDLYYKDDLKRHQRLFNDVYNFHNRVKEGVYKKTIKPGDTLLELAVGRGGDLAKWRQTKPSKVVGIDFSIGNLISPTQGAAVRYLNYKRQNSHEHIPPCLFVQGDMTSYPLFDQEDKYMKILKGEQTASTTYLSQFEKLTKFNNVSCQFALHYACETEEVFRNFVKNIEDTCEETFFGTCLDGKAVYSLLAGKDRHVFARDNQIAGEFTKQYNDTETWNDSFGMAIRVFLESFEKPEVEYLVPFDRIVSIFNESGFELIETRMFSDIYTEQNTITLNEVQQEFSFINRTFIFRRMEKKKEEEPKKEQEDVKQDDDTKDVKVDEEKPKKRKLRKIPEKIEEEPILFFGADESKGEYRSFSNMSNHPIEIDGIKFPTVEHYFQAMKAQEFKDDESYQKILKTKTPKAAKAAGKKVKNFVEEVWDSKRDGIMEKAVSTKFKQHPEIRKKLLETGDKLIGEANPRDTYWGIGTSMDLEKSKTPSKWRGQNKLGKLLMKLRDDFKIESQS